MLGELNNKEFCELLLIWQFAQRRALTLKDCRIANDGYSTLLQAWRHVAFKYRTGELTCP